MRNRFVLLLEREMIKKSPPLPSAFVLTHTGTQLGDGGGRRRRGGRGEIVERAHTYIGIVDSPLNLLFMSVFYSVTLRGLLTVVFVGRLCSHHATFHHS